jgi:branched-chain amino acid transport system ATP-binding protein
MLLDEPSFGLAPLVVQEVFEILADIKESMRVGMLLVEQNASLALELADQAYLIETGTIAVSGPASEIKADESIRAAYLGY